MCEKQRIEFCSHCHQRKTGDTETAQMNVSFHALLVSLGGSVACPDLAAEGTAPGNGAWGSKKPYLFGFIYLILTKHTLFY